ncbi:MAG: ribosome-associated translation inhibitor RaiA [Lachnospiraceae bacterium]|jgi:putative sigma-54 modulation protein|nr:ribosome-associated translation inhibitor RaiA [Lachnospiraceae bacterium]
MRINTYGKNIDVTKGMKNMVEEKLGKLEHYFKPETEVHVTFSVQGGKQKVEVTIPLKGTTIHAEEESEDMYASIDMIEDTIERQLRRYRKKLIDKKQSAAAASFADAFTVEDDEADEEIRIVRNKRFDMKPMDVEEACVQMELLNHTFFVFRNAETNEINVVYKRKGNTYGLIEPEGF